MIALQLALLGVVAPTWAIAAAALVGSAGLILSDNIWFTTLQARIPEEQLGRISSFDWLGSIALNPAGYALVGPLAAATSVRGVLLGASALLLGSSAVVLAIPSVRGLRAQPA